MSGRKNRGAGKTILLMLYVLLFLSGLSLLLYPKLNAIWIDYMLHRDAAEFLSFVYTDTYIPREDTSHVIIRNPEPTEPEETLPDEYPELWQQMRAYNEDIFRNGQEGLSGETAYEKPSFILADYGLESEVFAVLSIPKLDLEMDTDRGEEHYGYEPTEAEKELMWELLENCSQQKYGCTLEEFPSVFQRMSQAKNEVALT